MMISISTNPIGAGKKGKKEEEARYGIYGYCINE
jgi:hypothetical protein